LDLSFSKRISTQSPAGRFVILWLPVILWWAALTVGTSIPGEDLPRPPFRHSDLLAHVGLYGVLGFLLYRAIVLGTRLGKVRWAWLAVFAIVQLYGILDEIHQLWIPGRFCELYDALADGLGGFAGVVACLVGMVWQQGSAAAKESSPPDADQVPDPPPPRRPD